MSKYNLERQEQIRVLIVHIARQLVAGQIGVIAASRELGWLRHEVEPQLANALATFTGIDSETDTLPLGRGDWTASRPNLPRIWAGSRRPQLERTTWLVYSLPKPNLEYARNSIIEPLHIPE